jgi:hypothetical protein
MLETFSRTREPTEDLHLMEVSPGFGADKCRNEFRGASLCLQQGLALWKMERAF